MSIVVIALVLAGPPRGCESSRTRSGNQN